MGSFTPEWYEEQRRRREPKTAAPASTHAPFEGMEAELHNDIIKHCRDRGWAYFHGSTAHKTMRTVGEPDFTICADGGRVFFVEVKTKTGKLTPEQLALKMWMEKLGHTMHVVRSFADFLEVVK